MSKAIGICSVNVSSEVEEKIESLVSNFMNITYKINDANFDVFLLKPVENKINTEMLNEYIEYLKKTSINNINKVGIIIDFHLLSVQNQNKLLIYIEQNNDKLMQVFTFNDLSNVITTIKSRLNIINVNNNYITTLTEAQKREELYTKVITTMGEYDTYFIHKDLLDAIYRQINNKEYDKAFILYSTKVEKYDENIYSIIYKMLLSSIINKPTLAKKVLKLERQLNSHGNKKLQMDNIFLNIIEGVMWN